MLTFLYGKTQQAHAERQAKYNKARETSNYILELISDIEQVDCMMTPTTYHSRETIMCLCESFFEWYSFDKLTSVRNLLRAQSNYTSICENCDPNDRDLLEPVKEHMDKIYNLSLMHRPLRLTPEVYNKASDS